MKKPKREPVMAEIEVGEGLHFARLDDGDVRVKAQVGRTEATWIVPQSVWPRVLQAIASQQ